MKKIFLIITGVWLITILIVVGVLFKVDNNRNIYKININRIHSRLGNDWKVNKKVISDLSKEELGMISSVEVIDYRSINQLEEREFFQISDLYKRPVVYQPIKGNNYLVKYTIKSGDNRGVTFVICSIITILFLISLGGLLYIYKYIIEPMKRIAMIPKQLATGYIDKLEVPDKGQCFKDFIWGLDMLREKLKKERNRNNGLEKDRKTLVASLSHDIKTPLSSIKNYTIALKEGIYEESSAQNKAFDIILAKTEAIEKLTKELLESSLAEVNAIALEVKAEEIYLSKLSQRLNQIIQQKTNLLHIGCEVSELNEDLLVIADLAAISQVFNNIIENAIKYGDLGRVEVSYDREDYYQIIAIENTGQSIAKTEINHIFTSYYRGSNVREEPGHGLGLYICKEIMQAMEGDIYAQNTEIGVKFIIVIRLVS